MEQRFWEVDDQGAEKDDDNEISLSYDWISAETFLYRY